MRLRRVLLLLSAPVVVGLAGCTGHDDRVADAGTQTPTQTPTPTRSTAPGDFYPAPFMPAPGHPDTRGTPSSSPASSSLPAPGTASG